MMTDLTWRTEKRKISELLPHPNNPRKMSEKQVADLTASIEKFNLVEIPAIDADNTIIAGHQRLKVMQLIGRGSEEVEVRIPNRALTPAERDEYLLRSNKNIGEWDFELLANFDEKLLLGAGFSRIELAQAFGLSAKDDGYNQTPPAEATSKAGEVYELGEHRLMCGDSTDPLSLAKLMDGAKADLVFTDPLSLAKLMDGAKADLVFTDPPYGVSYVGKTKDALEIENDQMDPDELEVFLAKAFAASFAELKPGGAWYVTGPSGPGVGQAFARALSPHGWKHSLVWVKNSFVMGRADYHHRHEMIYYGWLDGAPHYFTEDRDQDSVFEKEPSDAELIVWAHNELEKRGDAWHIKRPSKSAEHPTMKPIPLVARAIKNSCLPHEIVLDPFAGSGSTLIAAHQLKRKAYLMELDPAYCDVIRKRWARYNDESEDLV